MQWVLVAMRWSLKRSYSSKCKQFNNRKAVVVVAAVL
jgi:hypothetical protein